MKPETPLPWVIENGTEHLKIYSRGRRCIAYCDKAIVDDEDRTDWQYIVHAANTLPALEAEVARLRTGLESLTNPYCFQANGGVRKPNCTCVCCDYNARIDSILKGG